LVARKIFILNGTTLKNEGKILTIEPIPIEQSRRAGLLLNEASLGGNIK